MKTSEEKLNEALQAALKRKFDDFEGQPNPSSYNLIRARLKQPRNYKYLFLTLLLIGVFVTGVMVDQYWMKKHPAVKAVSVTSGKVPVKPAGEELHKKAIASGIVQVTTAAGTTQRNLSRKASRSLIQRSDIPALAAKGNLPAKQAVSGSEMDSGDDQKVPDRQFGIEPVDLPSKVPVDSDVLMSDEMNPARDGAPIVPALNSDISEMEPGQLSPVSMHLPDVGLPEKLPLPHPIHTKSQKVSWLINVAGLKTYQILTVPQSAGEKFQNFRFPSVFSLESTGYKLSAGLEKSGFQLTIRYSAFRQKYSYEIAGDEYVVENFDQASYKIVRPGTFVTQNIKMELLGIGLNKQVQWGRSPFRKYYASAGLEYAHTMKPGVGIGWINASIGKQFTVDRTVLLNVGPYAEFSPSRISGADNPFLYQPYRVGISVGMKLIRP